MRDNEIENVFDGIIVRRELTWSKMEISIYEALEWTEEGGNVWYMH
jgi:hypothetical protein